METPAVLPREALRPAPRGPQVRADASEAEVRLAAKEFESLVLAELLAPMFEALDTDGLGGGGAGERMFRPMIVQEYAKSLAAAGGIGLADALTRDLLALQTEIPADAAGR